MSTQETVVPQWTLGDRLHKARLLAGIEAEDMADDIGRSRRTITNYENDSTTVPLLVIRQYASRTGVPIEWLIGTESGQDQGGDDDTAATLGIRLSSWNLQCAAA